MTVLTELLERVEDKESFLTFVKAVIKDREDEIKNEKKRSSIYGPGANGWENGTIETYLEASVACTEDHGDETILSEKASWQSFARFLYVGKSYE